MKKSRFQKAREEKELKKKLDDEEAAKVYDSFVASFTEDEQNGKTFVRGGNILESNNRGASESTKTEVTIFDMFCYCSIPHSEYLSQNSLISL
mmetsp:Transcript_23814/g.32777  ORF Transcript_23814/g.32777 Transcript_23814/m.32777 type:complete len:93 (-) Transcript_23814:3197-3475(-)